MILVFVQPRSCYRGNFVEASAPGGRAPTIATPRSCYRGNFVEACHDQEPLPDGFGLGLVTEATSLRRTSETCSDVVVFPKGASTQTVMTSTRSSRPTKSSGFRVTNGSSSATAIDAINRSAKRLRG